MKRKLSIQGKKMKDEDLKRMLLSWVFYILAFFAGYILLSTSPALTEQIGFKYIVVSIIIFFIFVPLRIYLFNKHWKEYEKKAS